MAEDCGSEDVSVIAGRRRYTVKPIDVKVPVFRLGAGPLDPYVQRCMNVAANIKAAALAEVLDSSSRQCVYIVASDDFPVCKIGRADQPTRRLAQLQNGNWTRLRVAGLLWAIDPGQAHGIEQTALRAAKEMNARLVGEWLDMTADEGMELALKAARYCKARVADSTMWIEGVTSRTVAVNNSRHPLVRARLAP